MGTSFALLTRKYFLDNNNINKIYIYMLFTNMYPYIKVYMHIYLSIWLYEYIIT